MSARCRGWVSVLEAECELQRKALRWVGPVVAPAYVPRQDATDDSARMAGGEASLGRMGSGVSAHSMTSDADGDTAKMWYYLNAEHQQEGPVLRALPLQ